jgi:hypothetical protein
MSGRISGKYVYDWQKTTQPGFCPLPVGVRTAVKALAGRKVPACTHTKEPTASKRYVTTFTFSSEQCHNRPPTRNKI